MGPLGPIFLCFKSMASNNAQYVYDTLNTTSVEHHINNLFLLVVNIFHLRNQGQKYSYRNYYYHHIDSAISLLYFAKILQWLLDCRMKIVHQFLPSYVHVPTP